MASNTHPSPQFVRSVAASVAYWKDCTGQLNEQDIFKLDKERRNIYRAVKHGLKLPQTWQDTAVLVLQLFDFVEWHDYWKGWIPVLEAVLARCPVQELQLRCQLLNRLGQLYRLDNRSLEAIALHKQVEKIAQEIRNEHALALAHYNLSEAYLRSHNYSCAEHYGLCALEESTHIEGEKELVAFIFNTLGEVARCRGNLAQAEKRLSQAVAVRRLLNQPVYLARSLNDLARTLEAAEKLEQAHQCYREAMAILEPTNNEIDKAIIHINRGVWYFKQKKWDQAKDAFQRANSPALRQSGYIQHRARVANNLGNTLSEQGQLQEAERYLRHAIILWVQTDDELELANSLGSLAEILVKKRQLSEAIPLYEEAIDLLAQYPEDAWAQTLQQEFKLALQALK